MSEEEVAAPALKELSTVEQGVVIVGIVGGLVVPSSSTNLFVTTSFLNNIFNKDL